MRVALDQRRLQGVFYFFSYTGGGTAILAVLPFVLVSIAQFGRATDF